MKMMTWCSELSYSFTWICTVRGAIVDGILMMVCACIIVWYLLWGFLVAFAGRESPQWCKGTSPPLSISYCIYSTRVSEEGTSLKLWDFKNMGFLAYLLANFPKTFRWLSAVVMLLEKCSYLSFKKKHSPRIQCHTTSTFTSSTNWSHGKEEQKEHRRLKEATERKGTRTMWSHQRQLY